MRLLIILSVLLIAGCASCPSGSIVYESENVARACEGKAGIQLTDKNGSVAGKCESSGPAMRFCAEPNWCRGGNISIESSKVECRLNNRNEVVSSTRIQEPSIATVKACRHRNHGVDHYLIDRVEVRESHWMGGGYTQERWCNDAREMLRGGDVDALLEVARSWENTTNTCWPANCPQYKYFCEIRDRRQPVFREMESSDCI